MNRKIIFLDIDGTLTEPGSNDPPKSALWAIREARAEGHLVYLCSGRNYEMLRPLLRYEFDGVIASSGGYIRCGDEVIYDCPMTECQRQTALRVLEENGVFRTVECLDGAYTDEGFKEYLRGQGGAGGNSELLRWREQIERSLHILPMSEYRGQPVYKIVIMSPSRERLDEPEKLLAEDFFFCLQEENSDGLINGEIVNRKFDKGKALEQVCRHLRIARENSIAIGDSHNDLEMLQAAGYGICMANGSEALKKAADEICPSVGDAGIRSVFLKHRLVTGEGIREGA